MKNVSAMLKVRAQPFLETASLCGIMQIVVVFNCDGVQVFVFTFVYQLVKPYTVMLVVLINQHIYKYILGYVHAHNNF